MTQKLNLADIQGNVVRAYGNYGYAYARYFFLNIQAQSDKGASAREFIGKLYPHITTAQRWSKPKATAKSDEEINRPAVTLNVAFTFAGLFHLGLPTRTLKEMPEEFIDGMAKRKQILGDIEHNDPEQWDSIWKRNAGEEWGPEKVHLWISMNALPDPQTGKANAGLEEKTVWLRKLVEDSNGSVCILSGHGKDGADYQDAHAQVEQRPDGIRFSRKEHFGFSDGYGNPVFEGQFEPDIEKERVIGRGKLMPDQTWQPLATGEFILGHSDESQQLPVQARPWEFTHNGTFLVYRKLHQNVKSFQDYIQKIAKQYASMMNIPEEEANETIRAKMAGRWSDGIPLMAAPTYSEWRVTQAQWKGRENTKEFQWLLMDFKYGEDKEGYKCPMTAHMRRVNTRDMLDPSLAPGNAGSDLNGSTLNKRRRILRRGLPYGSFDPNQASDEEEHGTIFIVVCASIFRQFEFVQQQWIQYGLDFNAGNDTCPLLGNHRREKEFVEAGLPPKQGKFVIPSDPASQKPPFICGDLPNFVITRGGDYFFLPSMTALNMIARGVIDPT